MDAEVWVALGSAVVAAVAAYVAYLTYGISKVSAETARRAAKAGEDSAGAAKSSAEITESMLAIEADRERRARGAELAPEFLLERANWGIQLGKGTVSVVLRNVGASPGVVMSSELHDEIASTKGRPLRADPVETGELTLVEFAVNKSAADLSTGVLLLALVYESPELQYHARATYSLSRIEDDSEGSWESDDPRISWWVSPG